MDMCDRAEWATTHTSLLHGMELLLLDHLREYFQSNLRLKRRLKVRNKFGCKHNTRILLTTSCPAPYTRLANQVTSVIIIICGRITDGLRK